MLGRALKFIREIESYGYKAYIVGGFVRDHILGLDSNDIDICTNATPKEIIDIFDDSCLPNEEYGSVTVIKYSTRFEITTFREEINYIDNRKPSKIKYVDDLEKDLLRRDFTINSFCMDKDGKIIDLLNAREDLNNRIIRTIGNAEERFEEDVLRILRAIRFATVLDFNLDDSVIQAIVNKKGLLKNLSRNRKKEELDKIFSSSNYIKGIDILINLGLDKELELYNLSKAKNADNPIGIWSILNVLDKYPFSSSERDLITKVNEVMDKDNLDAFTLYKYGLYVNSVAGQIKGIDKKDITEAYNNLPIYKKEEINITTDEILEILNKKPDKFLSDIYNDLVNNILYGKIGNNKTEIENYIRKNYS